MFSKSCEYGIKAIIWIANKSLQGKRCNLKCVAKGIESPEAFTAKILQTLANQNILQSVKGANGGYEILEKIQKSTPLLKVVEAIDGDKIYNGCALGFKTCGDDKPCPLHEDFKKIRVDLKEMLLKTSIYDLTKGIDNGLTFLKQ